jgi:glycosyltransferase involved in cell wall biosynthesis
MQEALVSVIIPVYNRVDMPRRAIDSVLKQSYISLEIIIVDDGSEPETALHIEQMPALDPRIKVLRMECNSGVSAARNHGISRATGDYIALLDSDDAWSPDKIKKQMRFFQTHPAYRICHTEEIWIRNGQRLNQHARHAKPEGRIFTASLPLCTVGPSSIMMHREVLDQAGLFDSNLYACEDYDLWLRLAARYSFGLLPDPLVVKYGGHADQLSRQYWGMDRFRIVSLLKVVDSPWISPEEHNACRTTIHNKSRILAQGAAKRHNMLLAAIYGRLAQLYEPNP